MNVRWCRELRGYRRGGLQVSTESTGMAVAAASTVFTSASHSTRCGYLQKQSVVDDRLYYINLRELASSDITKIRS